LKCNGRQQSSFLPPPTAEASEQCGNSFAGLLKEISTFSMDTTDNPEFKLDRRNVLPSGTASATYLTAYHMSKKNKAPQC